MTSISERNYLLISSSRDLADLNLCIVFKRSLFSFEETTPWLFLDAIKKILFVALKITLRGLDIHSIYSFMSYSTLIIDFTAYICLPNAFTQLPEALSHAKSLTNSITRAKLLPYLGYAS